MFSKDKIVIPESLVTELAMGEWFDTTEGILEINKKIAKVVNYNLVHFRDGSFPMTGKYTEGSFSWSSPTHRKILPGFKQIKLSSTKRAIQVSIKSMILDLREKACPAKYEFFVNSVTHRDQRSELYGTASVPLSFKTKFLEKTRRIIWILQTSVREYIIRKLV